MSWATLADVRLATKLTFTVALAARHDFVQQADLRWVRVLMPVGHPAGRVHRYKAKKGP